MDSASKECLHVMASRTVEMALTNLQTQLFVQLVGSMNFNAITVNAFTSGMLVTEAYNVGMAVTKRKILMTVQFVDKVISGVLMGNAFQTI